MHHFRPVTLLTTQKNKTFKKWKKKAWTYHFTHTYHKWKSYDVWFLRNQARQTKFFVIYGHFLPFYHPNNSKNQKFWKNEKRSGDVIILNKCTKNHDHMIHASWDMECDRYNFLSFWAIFCPFTLLTTQKNKTFKKMKKKKKGMDISFYTYVPKMKIIWCIVPEKSSPTDKSFCHFRKLFSPFYPPNNSKNQTFEKMNKAYLEMSSFAKVYQKSQSYDTCFVRCGVWQTCFIILGHLFALLPH